MYARGKVIGPRLRISSFKDDEANTRTETVLMMLGRRNPAAFMERTWGRASTSATRPRIRKGRPSPGWSTRNGDQATRTYLAGDASGSDRLPSSLICSASTAVSRRLPIPRGSGFLAIDPAIGFRQISSTLPFIKKTGLELLKATYSANEEAAQKIPAGLAAFYQQKYPDVASKRSGDVQSAGQALTAIYNRNVFPDLKVTWGTYPNNLGHTDDIGCFRCHDDAHPTADKKTISQDCSACHQSVAMEEASPEILKTLGLDHPVTSH